MISQVSQQSLICRGSLSRRGSKLLVEAVIGVIGILGIMLAQVGATSSNIDGDVINKGEQVIGKAVSGMTAQIDWSEILF